MKKLLLLLGLSLIFSNCATSTKEKLVWDANKKMNNVVFVLENFQYFKNGNDYLSAVENAFNKRNIKNIGFNYDEKILNIENKLKDKINTNNPNYILNIALSSISTGNEKRYQLEIVNVENQKIVWDGGFLTTTFAGPKSFSEKLMKELEKEKIIDPLKN